MNSNVSRKLMAIRVVALLVLLFTSASCSNDTVAPIPPIEEPPSDGGWTMANPQIGTNTKYGMFFLNADAVWIVGRVGTIHRTSDGGETWALQITPTQEDLRNIDFLGTQIGVAVGSTGTILWTNSGGATWAHGSSKTMVDLRGNLGSE